MFAAQNLFKERPQCADAVPLPLLVHYEHSPVLALANLSFTCLIHLVLPSSNPLNCALLVCVLFVFGYVDLSVSIALAVSVQSIFFGLISQGKLLLSLHNAVIEASPQHVGEQIESTDQPHECRSASKVQ